MMLRDEFQMCYEGPKSSQQGTTFRILARVGGFSDGLPLASICSANL